MPQKRVPGTILEIDLGDGTRTFGLINEWLSIVFLDLRLRVGQEVSEAAVIAAPVIFVTDVYDYALKSGGWPTVGRIDLAKKPMPLPIFYMYNRLKKVDPVTIITGSTAHEMRPGTIDECRDLEPLAVWEPEHIEERIRDHYADVPNIHYKAMKVSSGLWPRD